MNYFSIRRASLVFSTAVSAVLPYLVWAQEKCIVNGREVPCEEAFQSLGRAVGWGIGLILLFVAVILLSLIFWLWMLVHAIRNPISNKAVWLLLLLLTGIIGAIVYFFAVKRKFGKVAEPPAIQ